MLHALITNNLDVVPSWRAKLGSRRLFGPSAVCPQSTGLALQLVLFTLYLVFFLLTYLLRSVSSRPQIAPLSSVI